MVRNYITLTSLESKTLAHYINGTLVRQKQHCEIEEKKVWLEAQDSTNLFSNSLRRFLNKNERPGQYSYLGITGVIIYGQYFSTTSGAGVKILDDITNGVSNLGVVADFSDAEIENEENRRKAELTLDFLSEVCKITKAPIILIEPKGDLSNLCHRLPKEVKRIRATEWPNQGNDLDGLELNHFHENNFVLSSIEKLISLEFEKSVPAQQDLISKTRGKQFVEYQSRPSHTLDPAPIRSRATHFIGTSLSPFPKLYKLGENLISLLDAGRTESAKVMRDLRSLFWR